MTRFAIQLNVHINQPNSSRCNFPQINMIVSKLFLLHCFYEQTYLSPNIKPPFHEVETSYILIGSCHENSKIIPLDTNDCIVYHTLHFYKLLNRLSKT